VTDEELRTLDARRAELADLSSTTPEPKLPSLDDVLAAIRELARRQRRRS
jgi:hypothetical protein